MGSGEEYQVVGNFIHPWQKCNARKSLVGYKLNYFKPMQWGVNKDFLELYIPLFRILTAVSHLQSGFEEARGYSRYHPSRGYWWDFGKVNTGWPVKQGRFMIYYILKSLLEVPLYNFFFIEFKVFFYENANKYLMVSLKNQVILLIILITLFFIVFFSNSSLTIDLQGLWNPVYLILIQTNSKNTFEKVKF